MNIENAIKNLKNRGFDVSRFENKEQAKSYLLDSIEEETVGIGGSITIDCLDLYDDLCQKNKVFWHMKDSSPDVIENASRAQIYLSSANAIAETGEIVNIDGRGNRVAATMYGKKCVYIVVGINKFTENIDAAIDRAKNVAAPKNAARLGAKTPCAKRADKCYECNSPEKICRGLSVLWCKMNGIGRLEVVIIDENLGY